MTSANKAPTNDDDAWFPLTSPEIYIKNHEQSVFHVQKTPTPFSFSHCLSTNIWFKKTDTTRSSNILLRVVSVFLNQTLLADFLGNKDWWNSGGAPDTPEPLLNNYGSTLTEKMSNSIDKELFYLLLWKQSKKNT